MFAAIGAAKAEAGLESSSPAPTSKRGAKKLRDNLNDFSDGLKKAATELIDSARPVRRDDEEGAEWALREEGFRETSRQIENALNRARRLGESMSDADALAQKAALKNADLFAKLKMETSRTSLKVQLKNQAAEMEHSFREQLQAKVAELSTDDGKGKMLEEALEREAGLRRQLDMEKERAVKAEQREAGLKGELETGDSRASSAAAAAAEQIKELSERLQKAKGESEAALAKALAEAEAARTELEEVRVAHADKETQWAAELDEKVGAARADLDLHRTTVITEVEEAAREETAELRRQIRRLCQRLRRESVEAGVDLPEEPPTRPPTPPPPPPEPEAVIIRAPTPPPFDTSELDAAVAAGTARIAELEMELKKQLKLADEAGVVQQALKFEIGELKAALAEAQAELEAERGKKPPTPPPQIDPEQLKALQAEVAKLSSALEEIPSLRQRAADLDAELKVRSGQVEEAREIAQEMRAQMLTAQKAHEEELAGLSERILGEAARALDAATAEAKRLQLHSEAHEVGARVLRGLVRDLEDDLEAERSAMSFLSNAAEQAKELTSKLSEAKRKAEANEKNVSNCKAALKKCVDELLDLRTRAGQTAARGAAIEPSKDPELHAWFLTGARQGKLPAWLEDLDDYFTPAFPNTPLTAQLNTLLGRYKAVAASSTSDCRVAEGRLLEAEGALANSREEAERRKQRIKELSTQLIAMKNDVKSVEESLGRVTSELEGSRVAAAAERSHLVQSALASLHILRVHLAHQAGLRPQQTEKLDARRQSALAGIVSAAAMVPPASAAAQSARLQGGRVTSAPGGRDAQHAGQPHPPHPPHPPHHPSAGPAEGGGSRKRSKDFDGEVRRVTDPLPELPRSARLSQQPQPPQPQPASRYVAGTHPDAPPAIESTLGPPPANASPRRRRQGSAGAAVTTSAATATIETVGLAESLPPRQSAPSIDGEMRAGATQATAACQSPRHHPAAGGHVAAHAACVLSSGSPRVGMGQWGAKVNPVCQHPSFRKATWHEVHTIDSRAARAIELSAGAMAAGMAVRCGNPASSAVNHAHTPQPGAPAATPATAASEAQSLFSHLRADIATDKLPPAEIRGASMLNVRPTS